ncbi:hypothetical protein GOBAR_DD30098 [Gossypium barbadense]|nr:hypothetical protein GOBAR_DD30098 [Gossypium barbadense]
MKFKGVNGSLSSETATEKVKKEECRVDVMPACHGHFAVIQESLKGPSFSSTLAVCVERELHGPGKDPTNLSPLFSIENDNLFFDEKHPGLGETDY